MKEYKLTFGNIGYFIQEVTKLLQSTQKAYRVNIVEWREKRSLSQNNLYWQWMTEINNQKPLKCDSAVFKGAELWAEVFKKYYCPSKTISNGNNAIEIKSTTLLDTGEMTYYLNKIETWCIDNGIKLTVPENSEYRELMERQEQ